MYTSLNKKMKTMMGMLILTSLLTMVVNVNRPLILTYITVFTQMIFNVFFVLMLVVGCYAMLRKYEDEFSVQEMGCLALTSSLLLILSFMISNTVTDAGTTNLLQPGISVYLIDIIMISGYFMLRKMKYRISLTKTFLCYYVLTICLSILAVDISALQIIVAAWMQLGMLFWVEMLMNGRKYQKDEWLVLIGFAIVIAYLCLGCKMTLLTIPLIHICLFFYLSIMKQWVSVQQIQIVNIIVLVVSFIGFQFLEFNTRILIQMISILNIQVDVFLLSITLYIIEHGCYIKELLCTYAFMLIGIPLIYHNDIFILDSVFCIMQILAITLLYWMYKRQKKLSYIITTCLCCMTMILIVVTAIQNFF